MGSVVSRSDTNGGTLPAKFRPVFLQRLEELTSRRFSRPLKDSTLSKKELLSHENNNVSHHHHENSYHSKKPEEQTPKAKGSDKEKGVATRIDTTHVVKVENLKATDKDEWKENVLQDETDKEEDVFKDFDDDDDDDEDEDDNDEDGRMIGHQDGEAFPGSPSFRVYFNDNVDDDDIGKDDGHRSKSPRGENVSISTKDSPVNVRKQVKSRKKKRRSFKNAFQQGGQAAMKNIMNATACYTPSHSSQERNRLLADKTNT